MAAFKQDGAEEFKESDHWSYVLSLYERALPLAPESKIQELRTVIRESRDMAERERERNAKIAAIDKRNEQEMLEVGWWALASAVCSVSVRCYRSLLTSNRLLRFCITTCPTSYDQPGTMIGGQPD